jgi:hypothetical protein
MDTSRMVRDYGVRGRHGTSDATGLAPCTELRLTARALSKGWNVSPALRKRCLEVAEEVLNDAGATYYHKLTAIKVVALVDAIDAKREATAVRESQPPPQQINIFGDVSAYAGVFGEPADKG